MTLGIMLTILTMCIEQVGREGEKISRIHISNNLGRVGEIKKSPPIPIKNMKINRDKSIKKLTKGGTKK